MPHQASLKPVDSTRRTSLWVLLLCGSPLTSKGRSRPLHATNDQAMKLLIRLGSQALDVHLDDNPTARDLVSLLPLRLRLDDYAATEKIASLPRRLSTAQAPRGITPLAGDLTYYAPWGNLALFHKDFSFSAGLIRLGRIDRGVEYLARPGRLDSEWLRGSE